ncbi:MAG: hypothetical protein JXA73_10285 [Acidobacteria bacterium]|nr:hypothetical protein [Acidobacteriota bacterium]
MARGWESKSVEAQIEEAGSAVSGIGYASRKEPVELRYKREGLMLQRSRILQEIEAARNPRYRSMLDELLNHVELELAGLAEN